MMDTEFYTATMAGVYERQGHLERAADIYRYLLEREPGQKELTEALSRVEEKLVALASERNGDLAAVFDRWIRLGLAYRRVKQLKRVEGGRVADTGVKPGTM